MYVTSVYYLYIYCGRTRSVAKTFNLCCKMSKSNNRGQSYFFENSRTAICRPKKALASNAPFACGTIRQDRKQPENFDVCIEKLIMNTTGTLHFLNCQDNTVVKPGLTFWDCPEEKSKTRKEMFADESLLMRKFLTIDVKKTQKT